MSEQMQQQMLARATSNYFESLPQLQRIFIMVLSADLHISPIGVIGRALALGLESLLKERYDG